MLKRRSFGLLIRLCSRDAALDFLPMPSCNVLLVKLSPNYQERTKYTLHRRRWGRKHVLSGAEAARRSHKGWPAVSLQPHASPFSAQFFAAQRVAPEISLFPLRSSIYCVTAVIAVAFTRSAVRYPIVQPHPGAAPMPRIRRGPPNAASPRAAPFGHCYHVRHPAGQA